MPAEDLADKGMQADSLQGNPFNNDAVKPAIGTMTPVAPEGAFHPVIIDAAVMDLPAIFYFLLHRIGSPASLSRVSGIRPDFAIGQKS